MRIVYVLGCVGALATSVLLISCGSNKFQFQESTQGISETTTSASTVTGTAVLDIATTSVLQRVNFVLAHNTSASFVRFKDLIDQALQGFLSQLRTYPVLVSTLSLNRGVGLSSGPSTSGRSALTTCLTPFDPTLGVSNLVDLYYSCKNSLPITRITNKLEFKPSDSNGQFDGNVLNLKNKIAASIGDPALNSATRVENLLSTFNDRADPILDGGITIAVLMSHTDYNSSENTSGVYAREYTPNVKRSHPATRELVLNYTALNTVTPRNEQKYSFQFKWLKLNTDPLTGQIIEERTSLRTQVSTCTTNASGAPNPSVSPALANSELDFPAAFCPSAPIAATATAADCTPSQVSYLSRINNNAIIIADAGDPDRCRLVQVTAPTLTGNSTTTSSIVIPITDTTNASTCTDPFTRLASDGVQTAFSSANQYLVANASSINGSNETCTGVTIRPRANYFYQAGTKVNVAYSGATSGSSYGRMTTNLANQLAANGAPSRTFVLSVPADTTNCIGQSAKATPNFNATASALNQVTPNSAFTKSICQTASLSESLQQASEFIQTIQGRLYSVTVPLNNLRVTEVVIQEADGSTRPLTLGAGPTQYQWSLITGVSPSRVEVYLGTSVPLSAGAKLAVGYSGTQP